MSPMHYHLPALHWAPRNVRNLTAWNGLKQEGNSPGTQSQH